MYMHIWNVLILAKTPLRIYYDQDVLYKLRVTMKTTLKEM